MSYKALVSSDWNECLAPCGPFDAIAHAYPVLAEPLAAVFRQYTGNAISLGRALALIRDLLPGPLTADQMDDYLAASFATYRGVPAFFNWCTQHDIAVMINTTGMIGYFQRVFATQRLAPPAFLAAHPLVRYPAGPNDPAEIDEILETADKPVHTARVAKHLGLAPDKVILIGDSGGDGPHFEWGAGVGARLIGSMTKPSLTSYCQARGIAIDHHFGVKVTPGQPRDREMAVDFATLAALVEDLLGP